MNIDQTDPGLGKFVIDDDNYEHFVKEIKDPNKPGVFGAFDDKQVQTGFASPFSRSVIPRSQWKGLIEFHEANRSSPDHWRLHAKVPVMNQASWGYCWGYGTGGAINTRYAMTGYKGIRLNPFPTCYRIKNGRNQGGWGGEFLKGADDYGIPEEKIWPPDTKDGSLLKSHEYELNSKMHNAVVTEELERENFDALCSAILDPERPCPVTMGLQWWGHLIYGVKVVEIRPGQFGIKIVNSWKPSWGQDGCSVLAESKARAFEQIAIVSIEQRVAA